MVCDAMMFFLCQFYYPEDAKSYNVSLKILWGEMYPKQLDNPNNVQGNKNNSYLPVFPSAIGFSFNQKELTDFNQHFLIIKYSDNVQV